jgi:exopolysaccharide biosynthesis polyprenyl glycosylphosphotransferase
VSAAIIDIATREVRAAGREAPATLVPVERPFGVDGDLDGARNLLRARSAWGPLLGLTRRDLDHAVARIERGTRFYPTTEFLKRLVDVVLSLMALVPLIVLTPLIALAIKLDSPGPVFYRQSRVGRSGREFGMFKFRTMRLDSEAALAKLMAERDGADLLFKMRTDPRITKVGAVLRKFSLDELPQFLNVIAGDMSVVGPRPPLPREVREYVGRAFRRLYVKPGITGLWQVSGRSDLTWEESIRLDLYYIENWSLSVDLQIMWRTVRVAFAPTSAY